MSKKKREITPNDEPEKLESKFRTIVTIKSETPKKLDELLEKQDRQGFDYIEKIELGGNEIAFVFRRR